MKVLTIKEPYATLIKEGIKKYEFRTWKTNYRGYVLIHAGKGVDKNEIKKYNYKYSSGYIIAKVKITDCIKITDEVRKMLENENKEVYSHIINDKTWNGYAFKLENAGKIKPIYAKGKLGLWNYDYKE